MTKVAVMIKTTKVNWQKICRLGKNLPKKLCTGLFALAATLIFSVPAHSDQIFTKGAFDWRKISYERKKEKKIRDSWEISNVLGRYFDDEFESDTANITSLTYRATDNISKSYARFHRFQIRNKLAFDEPDETYLRLSATTGFRYKFDKKRRIDVPFSADWTKFYNEGEFNDSFRIGVNPEIRMPYGEGNSFRLRMDLQASHYFNRVGRDDIVIRLRPRWYISTSGPYSFVFGIVAERRKADFDFNSRKSVSASFTVTRDIEEQNAYVDLFLSQTKTWYDAASTVGRAGERTDSSIIEVSYNKKMQKLNSATISLGLGYEYVQSNRVLSTYESPYVKFGIKKRF
jgi:hypothetical protein